jgi:hypothetical protein
MLYYTVVAIFAVWFAFTVAVQFSNPVGQYLSRFDSLLLLPTWTLFAPTPGIVDYHIFYRCVKSDGQSDDWIEIHGNARASVACPWLWNPARRLSKSKYVLLADLVVASQECLSAQSASSCYLSVAKFAASQIPISVDTFQFAVKKSFGHVATRSPEIAFVSEVLIRSQL